MGIPKEYTECEEYEGYIIVIKDDWYSVASKAGVIKSGGFRTRANARLWIRENLL